MPVPFDLDLQTHALRHHEPARERLLERGVELIARRLGEEAERAEVHAEQRHLALADRARRREQRPVAAEHDQEIDAPREILERDPLPAEPARGLAVEQHLDAVIVQPFLERDHALGHLRLVALHAHADRLELHAWSITRC